MPSLKPGGGVGEKKTMDRQVEKGEKKEGGRGPAEPFPPVCYSPVGMGK